MKVFTQFRYNCPCVSRKDAQDNVPFFDTFLSEQRLAFQKWNNQLLTLDAGLVFDVAHSSLLQRANKTCQKILEMTGSSCEMKRTWRLNERHYG